MQTISENRTTKPPASPQRGRDTAVLSVLALYYLLTGIWPVLHIRSFTAITGPKTDVWLVKTFGLLVVAIGGWIFFALTRQRHTEAAALGLSTGAALAAADVYYVATRRISPVYLLDAVLQALFFGYWLKARQRAARSADEPQIEALTH